MKDMRIMKASSYKYISVILLIVLVVALGTVGYLYNQLLSKPEVHIDIVSVQFDWTITGKYAPFYVAVEKGFFEEEGISLRIFSGSGSSMTVANIAGGKFDFGLVDTPVVILNRNAGGKVKIIGVQVDKSPIAYVALKSSGIDTPKKFEGKTFGISAWDASRKVLPILCQINNINYSSITIVTLDPAVILTALLTKEVDFSGAWLADALPPLLKQAATVGQEINVMKITDYGLDFYSTSICTTESFLAEKPDLVKRFLRAYNMGVKYAVDHPDEAVDIIIKYVPALGGDNADITKAQWYAQKLLIDTPTAQEYGYSWVDREKMQETLNVTVQVLGGALIPVDELYTNDYLPGKL